MRFLTVRRRVFWMPTKPPMRAATGAICPGILDIDNMRHSSRRMARKVRWSSWRIA